MRFTIDKHEKYVVIQPHVAFLDGETAPKIKGEFLLRNTGGQRNIVLDLSHVEDGNASGLRTILLAHRLCNTAHGAFILVNANEKLTELIKISKLDTVLTIVGSVSKAEDLIFSKEIEQELLGGTLAE